MDTKLKARVARALCLYRTHGDDLDRKMANDASLELYHHKLRV
jgi:hypothetical protein